MPPPELPLLDPFHAKLYEAAESVIPEVQDQLAAANIATSAEPLHTQDVCQFAAFLIGRALYAEGFDTSLRVRDEANLSALPNCLVSVAAAESRSSYLIDTTYGQFLKRFGIEPDHLPDRCLVFPATQTDADLVVRWMADLIKWRWPNRLWYERRFGTWASRVNRFQLEAVLAPLYTLDQYRMPYRDDLEWIAGRVKSRPNE